jgi:SWI/SNF-related matrix-associated actin-dependent regulator 1 of chromatin subfamily A
MDIFDAARSAIKEANDMYRRPTATSAESGLEVYSSAIAALNEVFVQLGIEPMPHQKVVVEAVRSGFRQLLLADQMGVGKTLSAIASVEDQNAYPALIVCPSSLKFNWERECKKAVPHRTVAVLSGQRPDWGQVTSADIIVCPDSILSHWTMVPNGKKSEPKGFLTQREWEAFIIDECHTMKNHDAQRTRAAYGIAKGLNARAIRMLMSGTPILNRPTELVAPLGILGLLGPVFGSRKQFESRYCEWEWNGFGHTVVGAKNLEELNEKLRAYCMIRRTRAEVLTLPNKGRVMETVEMPPASRFKYQRALDNLQDFFRDKSGDKDYTLNWRAEAMMLLMALRQVSGEGKVDAAVEKAEQLIDDGESVFLTTCHTAVAEELSKRLFKHGVVSIVGGMSSEQKQKSVDDFQSGKAKVCIGNITAAGVGFTLTKSANVIVVELPWTPGALQQVEDRLHRIGQTRPVTSTVLISEWPNGSVDERLWGMMDGKAQIINAILDGENVGLDISDEGSFQNSLLDSFKGEA